MMLKPTPVLVPFAGHMFDRPERKVPRFPLSAAGLIQSRLRAILAELEATAGYCSLACGADMLFAEAMLDRQAELHVVLPFAREKFLETSVNVLPSLNLTAHFEKILQRATHVTVISGGSTTPDTLAYGHCMRRFCELASLRAESLHCPLRPLAVWDGQAEDSPGGTAAFVQYWQERSFSVNVVGLQ